MEGIVNKCQLKIWILNGADPEIIKREKQIRVAA